VFATGLLLFIYLYFSGLTKYINIFLAILFLTISFRVALTYYSKKINNSNLVKLANLYAAASFVIALNFAILSFTCFNVAEFELRYFILLVHTGLITAAIITMSVWMNAYLAFSVPQLLVLISLFITNNSISIAIITMIFSVFILITAKNHNAKFKEGQLLIAENNQLISDLETEIINKDKIQLELENQHEKLEGMVAERTNELETINADLN